MKTTVSSAFIKAPLCEGFEGSEVNERIIFEDDFTETLQLMISSVKNLFAVIFHVGFFVVG